MNQPDARPDEKAEEVVRNSDTNKEQKQDPPEKLRYSRYYEHDGALRAYANRAMVLAFLCVPTALIAVGFAAYVRLQPPILIRVDASGEASVACQKNSARPAVNVVQGASTAATDFERKAFVRLFLDRYLNFSPTSVTQSWADSLNMMTADLRQATLKSLEKDNTVGKIDDEQITSILRLRSLEEDKTDPLQFAALGAKEIHRVHDHHEIQNRLVGEFHIRLITEKRSEENPSGLLIAGYGEKLIEAQRVDSTAQGKGETGDK